MISSIPIQHDAKTALITMDVEQPDLYTDSGMDMFLRVLDDLGFKATFFVTYQLAKSFPGCIEKFLKGDHEVASHGYSHPAGHEVFSLLKKSKAQIEDEIEKSKLFLRDYGVEPEGIRLPAFQWNRHVLEVISRYFKYDSSVAPGLFRRKIAAEIPAGPLLLGEKLIELPVSAVSFLKIRLGTPPFFGLGAQNLIRLVKLSGVSQPIMFYCHSFDLTEIDTKKLTSRKWKKKWYYQRCGPSRIEFFKTFFTFLKEQGFKGARCIDFVNNITANSAFVEKCKQ